VGASGGEREAAASRVPAVDLGDLRVVEQTLDSDGQVAVRRQVGDQRVEDPTLVRVGAQHHRPVVEGGGKFAGDAGRMGALVGVDDDRAGFPVGAIPRERGPGDDRQPLAGKRVTQAAAQGPTTFVIGEWLDRVAAVIDARREDVGELDMVDAFEDGLHSPTMLRHRARAWRKPDI
jgi:hypothetical protein